MKLGIFLTLIGVFITFLWLYAYMSEPQNPGNLFGTFWEAIVGLPCLYFGIRRLRRVKNA